MIFDLPKDKKYCIAGIAHQGTCSMERYMVEQQYDVIRDELAFDKFIPRTYRERYPDRIPVFVAKSQIYLDQQKKKWDELNGYYFIISELAKLEGFPWDNKGGKLNKAGIRPEYKKDGNHYYPKGFR